MNTSEHEQQIDDLNDASVTIVDLESTIIPPKRQKHLLAFYQKCQRSPLLRKKIVRLTFFWSFCLVSVIILGEMSGVISLISTQIPFQGVVSSQNTGSSIKTQDGLACTEDATWSPDSSRIAIIGYQKSCTLNTYRTGYVIIYSNTTKSIVERLKPDQIILSKFPRKNSAQRVTPIIVYGHIIWSPDGTSLAVTFFLTGPANAGVPQSRGVVIFHSDGKTTLLSWSPSHGFPRSFITWNLLQGTAKFEQSEIPSFPPWVSFNTVLAPAYQWNAAGFLVPEAQKDFNKVQPVGNAHGDGTFTIWQPGQMSATFSPKVNLYSWRTNFVSWSPDGKYLADTVFTGGLLEPPGHQLPEQKTLTQFGLSKASLLQIPDRAFQSLLQGLANQDKSTSIMVSWRPDGKFLATYMNNRVDIYNCTTGKKEQSFIPDHGKPLDLQPGQDTLIWSPNGKYLLLSSAKWGVISLWNPNEFF